MSATGSARADLPPSDDTSISPQELRARLQEAEETLKAIRNGEVDAIVVGGRSGEQVYTLENADRPYRVLVEQMQEGAVTLAQDGTILYCNNRFTTLVDRPREGVLGQPIMSFLHPADRDVFGLLLADLPGTGNSGEFRLSDHSATQIPVNISLVELIVEENAPRLMCGVVTDLSHNRQRSRELADANDRLNSEIDDRKRAEESLRLALDASGMGVWEFDYVSHTAEHSYRHDQIFGYPSGLIRWSQQAAIEHFLEADSERVREAFDRAFTHGHIDFQARIRRANDGEIRWLQMKGQTYYEDGKPRRVAGVVSDVTDRMAIEEQVRQAMKMEAIGQLTGGVAHDFNNLLMVISGGLEVLNRQSDPARRERVLNGMKQAVQRGSGLSKQLLAFSRRQALRPEPIDLRHQINGMRELLDRSLRGDVQVSTQFQPDLWPAEVDPGELELVILNLAVNARDAMADGGEIVISAENFPDLVDGDLRGDFVKLSVIDQGTGMAPEVLAHVFEPFYTTKEVGKGSGLGLAQTHGFVTASGGGVRIESQPGEGTTVSLLLPRTLKQPAVSADTQEPTRPQPSGGCTGQVLVVEDDDEVAALTVEMIHELGYQTTRVASAEAALGALANGRPIDLVFSDVMMPGAMNGLDLAHEIRQRRPALPVLLTSGYAEAIRERALAHQIKVLAKPYRLDDLAQAFASALHR